MPKPDYDTIGIGSLVRCLQCSTDNKEGCVGYIVSMTTSKQRHPEERLAKYFPPSRVTCRYFSKSCYNEGQHLLLSKVSN